MYGIGSLALGAPGKLTVLQRAIALLRKFGTNAHVYLPGVGTLNGLQAANYLDSAGTTQGTVDQPVGLALDAEGVLGVELVTNGDFSAGATGWTLTGGWSVSGGTAQNSGTLGSITQTVGTLTIGKSYVATFNCTSTLTLNAVFGGAYVTITPVIGLNTVFGVCTGSTALAFQGANVTTGIDNVSCKEITGIHASQSTTPSKPVLRRGIVCLNNYSKNRQSEWYGSGFTANSATQIQIPNLSYQVITFPCAAGGVYTTAAVLSGTPGERVGLYIQDNAGAYGSSGTNITLTATPMLYVWTRTMVESAGMVGIRSVQPSNVVVDIAAQGVFQGTLTAAQIQALGGIPLTTTAPASTALGPYWWDFQGSQFLGLSGLNTGTSGAIIAGCAPSATGWEMVAGSGAQLPANAGVRLGIQAASNRWVAEGANGSFASAMMSALPPVIGVTTILATRWSPTAQDLWVNGAQQGTTSSNVAPSTNGFVIGGSMYGPSNPGDYWKGSIYPIVVLNVEPTVAELATLSRLVASMSGVTI
jgi:hypothetical protein